MEGFVRALESTRVFPITTEFATYETLYLLSCFRNWPDAYNLCSPSRLTETQEGAVLSIAEKSDYSPRAWISSFCRVANVAIDKLAADMLKVKMSSMRVEEMKRAREANDASIHISIQELSGRISPSFGSFCTMLHSGNGSDPENNLAREVGSLTIDDVDAIDRVRKKEMANSLAQSNLARLIRSLGITPITFWFTIYVVGHMMPEELQKDMMGYLYHSAGTEAIFTEETYAVLGKWKSSATQQMGSLNSDSMSFFFMYHRRV
jgi:hypothetical protein